MWFCALVLRLGRFADRRLYVVGCDHCAAGGGYESCFTLGHRGTVPLLRWLGNTQHTPGGGSGGRATIQNTHAVAATGLFYRSCKMNFSRVRCSSVNGCVSGGCVRCSCWCGCEHCAAGGGYESCFTTGHRGTGHPFAMITQHAKQARGGQRWSRNYSKRARSRSHRLVSHELQNELLEGEV